MPPRKESKEDNKYQTQNIISKALREKINMEVFIKKSENTMVKNTFGITCPNCGSDQIYAETVQLRSSDEASDRICTCLDCHIQFKISGSSNGKGYYKENTKSKFANDDIDIITSNDYESEYVSNYNDNIDLVNRV